MHKCKKLWRIVSAFCLSGILLLNAGVAAAEIENSTLIEMRQEDLEDLYENLRLYHPDMYANTPEDVFVDWKAEIEGRLDTESDVDFVLDLQSLAALIGDSHTKVSISGIADETAYYPMKLTWFDGEWILSDVETTYQNLLGAQVTAVNGLSIEQVLERFSKFLSADNSIKLRRLFQQSCYVEELYRYAGIIDDNMAMNLSLCDSTGQERTLTLDPVDYSSMKELSLSSLSQRRTDTPDTAYDKSKYYFSMALNSNTYYIQYNSCAEDPELPMESFCEQISSDLEAGNYQLILVDLRNNGGGSDGVIYPLLLLLRQEIDENEMQVAALIGETTFSSAIINAVELQEMGCILAGEATSGSVDHFGSAESFQLTNSGLQVQVSSKYIALSNLFDAAAGKGVEPLTPDVEISQTLTDYLAGRDTCVEKLLADPTCLKPEIRDAAPLTRSRFVGMLYESMGSREQEVDQMPFADLLAIEWYIPALNWAAEENIALGTGDNMFSAARTLTWQEAAVFLMRTAQAMELELAETIDSQPPEVLLTDAWNIEAIEQAWKCGLLPQDADFTVSPTRAQGVAMTEKLRQALL